MFRSAASSWDVICDRFVPPGEYRYRHTVRFEAWLFAAILLAGCPDDPVDSSDAGGGGNQTDAEIADAGRPPEPPPEVCPRAPADIIRGDVNGDGVVDVADPIAFENYLFHDDPEPACRNAADVTDDNLIELDDALAIVSYLVVGTQSIGTLEPDGCANAVSWPQGQCAPLALELDAPARVTASSFTAKVAIRSPTLAVQGWSMSIRATDCTITRATTEGTLAAEIWDDPPGIRHLGYSASVPVDGGAIAYVTLSVTSEVRLPASADQAPILALEVGSVVPASGCAQCTISIADDLSWTGETIDAVIAADGYAYKPNLPSKTIDVCAP